jgi:hypothetical protein
MDRIINNTQLVAAEERRGEERGTLPCRTTKGREEVCTAAARRGMKTRAAAAVLRFRRPGSRFWQATGKDFPSFLDEQEPEATERSSNAAEAQREGDEGGRKRRGKVGGPTCQ